MIEKTSISIIIPAFNEENAIGETLKELTENIIRDVHEIVIIDDGSKDNTANIVRDFKVRLIQHTNNLGYGAAIKTGIVNTKSDFVLMMDSDGQHRIEDVKSLVKSLRTHHSDMIIGNREDIFHSQLWRMPGKWILNYLANIITKQKIPDLNSGLRIMNRKIAEKYINIYPDGFSLSTTLTITFLKLGYDVKYLPIKISKRIGKSTITPKTGIDTLILILRIASLFDPLRVFLPASFIFGLTGVIWGVPYALKGYGISVGAMLLIVTSLLIFALGLICDQISQIRLDKYK